MICPECKMELTAQGKCITLGCIHYRFPEYWTVSQDEEIPIEEDNHFA